MAEKGIRWSFCSRRILGRGKSPPAIKKVRPGREGEGQMFGSKDIGIDLGTANTLIYMKGKGIIMREPSVVAVDIRNDHVIHVGQKAKDVVGRTPGSIVAIRPLKDGVIADFDITASMLSEFIKSVVGKRIFGKPRIVICIPSGVTAVEKRAVREAAETAGGKSVAIIEEPMAAAIGAGLPVEEAIGSMVVDIGGGTSEVAVISMGGIVTSKSVRVAGDEFDRNIIAYIKKKYNLLIGERTAEDIKIKVGSAVPLKDELDVEVNGRDVISGLPKTVRIESEEIRRALNKPLDEMTTVLVKHYKLKSVIELYAAVAEERLPVTEIKDVLTRYLAGENVTRHTEERAAPKEKTAQQKKNGDCLIISENLRDVEYKLGKCCSPIYGDDIFAFVTVHNGITVHRQDCPNGNVLRERFPYRVLDAAWSEDRLGNSLFSAKIMVVGDETIGLEHSVREVLKDLNVSLRSMRVDYEKGTVTMQLNVEVRSLAMLDSVIHKLMPLKGIRKVHR